MQVAERLRPLARHEPWIVLAPLVVAQWVAVAIFGLTVQRNGWLFYQGGDQTWFYTSGWILSGGEVPETLVGYVWALVQMPVAAVAGPNLLAGLPAIVLLQFLLLLPLGLLLVYGITSRIVGRRVGYAAATLWIALPYLATILFVDRYHERYVEQVLPQTLGLTALADFPSMIALLAAAYFFVRALDSRARADVIACGLAAGLAIGIKPSNGLFVLAPIVGFAVARCWREILAFAAALAPGLLTLALWKYKGSGIALFANETLQLASSGAPDYGPPTFLERVRQYVPLDRHQLNQQFLGLREFFWSARMLEFAVVAGVIGAFRRSAAHAAFLVTWLAAFFLVKGSSPAVTIESGSFWRLLMPAFPAFFILLAAIPLLAPVFGGRFLRQLPAPPRALAWRRPVVLVILVLVFVVPFVSLAVLPSADEPPAAKVPLRSLYLPLDAGFRPAVTPVQGGLQISWPPYRGSHAGTFYIVYRAPLEYTFETTGLTVSQGLMCADAGSRATRCSLEMEEVGRGRGLSFFDRVGRGTWTYRVAVAANWLDDPDQGDAFVVSGPLNVRVA
jgi:hypothetical protein